MKIQQVLLISICVWQSHAEYLEKSIARTRTDRPTIAQ